MTGLDLDADIVAGRSAAGVELGAPVSDLPGGSKTVSLTGCDRLDWPHVRIWVSDGAVQQIGVRGNYRGKLQGYSIGIGSTLAEVERLIGPVSEDEEDNLGVKQLPGWCFDTQRWRVPDLKDPGAQVIEICVTHIEAPETRRFTAPTMASELLNRA